MYIPATARHITMPDNQQIRAAYTTATAIFARADKHLFARSQWTVKHVVMINLVIALRPVPAFMYRYSLTHK